ncbi:hypothetical protein [Nocardioides acrostichi]|uniref:Uncharacterized protein n=1 Tax=Nocardioides acrostichi TaxID=2784339 RepID=A0A930Y5Z6_9ACTN|nr:hypothetical protein [Nocardioides acrostichi]MBF4161780.1 hypothetical protein [Nocardioides acrostichi]
MAGDDDVKMDPSMARPVIDRFTTMRQSLSNAQVSVSGAAGLVEMGCGEFGPVVSDGSDGFSIAWRESLHVTADSAGIIAGNTNVFEIEITRLDNELATVPDISGGGGRGPRAE